MESLLKKIAITLVFWCLPLLLFPGGWFVQVGFPAPEPLLFVRLLGAAYAALVAGYIDGLKGIAAGKDPTPTLRMGVCSNGLAFVILLGTGIRGSGASGASGRRFSFGCRPQVPSVSPSNSCTIGGSWPAGIYLRNDGVARLSESVTGHAQVAVAEAGVHAFHFVIRPCGTHGDIQRHQMFDAGVGKADVGRFGVHVEKSL